MPHYLVEIGGVKNTNQLAYEQGACGRRSTKVVSVKRSVSRVNRSCTVLLCDVASFACAAGVLDALNDMLLQSWRGYLQFFPCWPADKAGSFRGMRARGAFAVSASYGVVRQRGTVSDVQVFSESGVRCVFTSGLENTQRDSSIIAHFALKRTLIGYPGAMTQGPLPSEPRFASPWAPGKRVSVTTVRGGLTANVPVCTLTVRGSPVYAFGTQAGESYNITLQEGD